MKKVLLSFAVLAVIGMTSCKNQTEEKQETTEEVNEMAMAEITFGVRGNCGMCKKNIETAANSVDGVLMANWDIDLKKIDVKFDDTKTNKKAIHKAIAASGYDTDQIAGNEDAYKDLPQCCQFDHTMEMSLTEPADGQGGNHHHME